MDPNLDDELVQDYLAECREHLATIEQDLLAIEQGGADIDEHLVNQVFRAAHSIKGGAGFFDLTKIRELAHKTENALDLIRSRQMIPTPEVVSILLMAFDKLRELIGDYGRSNEAEIDDFVSALTALTSASLPADQRDSLDEQVEMQLPEPDKHIQTSAFDLSQARRGGKCIYLIQYDLIHDVQRLGKTPLEVFKVLIQSGTILETVFDLGSAGTLDEEPSNRLVLEVLYATVLEPDLIGQVVDVPPERVRLVEKNGESRPLSSPPAKRKLRARKAKAPVDLPTPQPAPKLAPAPREVVLKPSTPLTVSAAETTIRLNVSLLDSLMTLAGELVLGRNQLNESLSRTDERGIRSGAQRVSLVTSELQEVVTQTRMQPVGGLFAKFSRLVRDLARDLGKEVFLKTEGNEVEIDKTILEGLGDPLTHMVT
ncbi:MAG: Hpt domain-containing protein [Ignavibacteriota bacterium]